MEQKKVTSRSALARELLAKGTMSPKAIAKRTGLAQQTIYSIKWNMANKQGLGAIKPTTPDVGKGTGITSAAPLTFDIIDHPNDKRVVKASNNRRKGQLKRWARERAERAKRQVIKDMYALNAYDPMEYPIPARQPKQQTVWQRIKAFFGA